MSSSNSFIVEFPGPDWGWVEYKIPAEVDLVLLFFVLQKEQKVVKMTESLRELMNANSCINGFSSRDSEFIVYATPDTTDIQTQVRNVFCFKPVCRRFSYAWRSWKGKMTWRLRLWCGKRQSCSDHKEQKKAPFSIYIIKRKVYSCIIVTMFFTWYWTNNCRALYSCHPTNKYDPFCAIECRRGCTRTQHALP